MTPRSETATTIAASTGYRGDAANARQSSATAAMPTATFPGSSATASSIVTATNENAASTTTMRSASLPVSALSLLATSEP